MGLGTDILQEQRPRPGRAEESTTAWTRSRAGFLAITVSCARCHDHKFDPIPTRDYYSIAGIYMGTNMTDEPLLTPTR